MKNNFFILFLFPCFLFGQNKKIDSLKLVLKNAKHDTIKCITLKLLYNAAPDNKFKMEFLSQRLQIAESNLSKKDQGLKAFFLKQKATSLNNIGLIYFEQGNIPKALEYYNQSLKAKEELGDKQGLANSLNNIGNVYKTQNNIPKALEFYQKSLKLKDEIGDKPGKAATLNNIAMIYRDHGDVKKALEYVHNSLRIYEEIGDKFGIATAFCNIGIIYKDQGDYTKALESYNKSLTLNKEIKDKQGVANLLNNLGIMFKDQGNNPKALEYYYESLKTKEEIGDKFGIATLLNNIGAILKEQDQIPKALEHFKKSLKISEEIGDKKGEAIALCNIGNLLLALGKVKESFDYSIRSLLLSKELGHPINIKDAAACLKVIYSKQNKYKEAFEMFELEIKMNDSISNQETQKAAIKKQIQYTYEKKAALDSVAHVKENNLKNAEITARKAELKVKQNTQYGLFAGLALLLIFAGFMFNRFKVIQKQKQIIEIKEKETQQQKHIIEEKHKEITDSINYAERIQRSFIATKEILDQNLNDYFVLFKPKDVVSGDFYWASKLNNGKFAFVTADSTGHGVPGAIMSLLNITSLEKAVETLNEPSEILNATRKTIIERLKKDGSEHGGKDGMDASLTVYDFKNKKLVVASANNSVWIMRGAEVIDIKADKMPVGKHDRDNLSFTQHEIDLQSGDVVYALTDGFPDQFGGHLGKKFMSKNLRELLSKNAHLPMQEQKKLLETTFKDWAGNLEQVDDVTITGVRV